MPSWLHVLLDFCTILIPNFVPESVNIKPSLQGGKNPVNASPLLSKSMTEFSCNERVAASAFYQFLLVLGRKSGRKVDPRLLKNRPKGRPEEVSQPFTPRWNRPWLAIPGGGRPVAGASQHQAAISQEGVGPWLTYPRLWSGSCPWGEQQGGCHPLTTTT